MLRAEALSALVWLSHGFIQLNLESCPQFISSHFPTTCHGLYYPPKDTFHPAVQPACPKAQSVSAALCYSAWLYHKELGFIFALPSSYWAVLPPPLCQTQQAWIPLPVFQRCVLHASEHLGRISQNSSRSAKSQQDLGVHICGPNIQMSSRKRNQRRFNKQVVLNK